MNLSYLLCCGSHCAECIQEVSESMSFIDQVIFVEKYILVACLIFYFIFEILLPFIFKSN